jgi:hypothetical protein
LVIEENTAALVPQQQEHTTVKSSLFFPSLKFGILLPFGLIWFALLGPNLN